jgi:hypothetical protein
MSLPEKLFSIFSIGYIAGLAIALACYPQTRQLPYLLILSLLGVVLNVGLLYVVFKDIFTRRFTRTSSRYLWIIVIFLFMPAIILYLPLHGFKKRSQSAEGTSLKCTVVCSRKR